eukprot:3498404-Amphidinium_carterae.1
MSFHGHRWTKRLASIGGVLSALQELWSRQYGVGVVQASVIFCNMQALEKFLRSSVLKSKREQISHVIEGLLARAVGGAADMELLAKECQVVRRVLLKEVACSGSSAESIPPLQARVFCTNCNFTAALLAHVECLHCPSLA